MKSLLIRLSLLAAWAINVCAGPDVIFLDGNHLEDARKKLEQGDKSSAPAFHRLFQQATNALQVKPFTIVDEHVPPSGDKHDYMTQAPYFWRNPDTANGLPYVRRDGERNPEIDKFPDHKLMDDMIASVETLSLAYYFTREERFAKKAAELLRVWFIDPATRMNPNLQYAQAIPGISTGRGIGLIESRGFTRVPDALSLIAGSNAWREEDRKEVVRWYEDFLAWMLKSQNGRDEAAAKNNHGTYYDLQTATYACFVGKSELAREIVLAARERRIAQQIEPDGRQPLELVRTRAWSYSLGNLQGLMTLAILGEKLNVDLWNFKTADGRGIRRALDYLVGFAEPGAKWPHQQLGGFSRDGLVPVLRMAARKYNDSKYKTLLDQFPPLPEDNRTRLTQRLP